MIRKFNLPPLLYILSTVAIVSLLFINHTVAAASSYNLISNAVYLNEDSMSRSEIQSFLENKGSALATYKDQGPNETKKELASYLIWHAAQIWGINPQVIIATLQKEQSLITKASPSSIDYRSAMGYGCPDGAACNTSYYGFANQVNMASYQFRYNYEVLKGNTSFLDGDGDPHGIGQYACNGATGFYSKALRPGNTVTFKRNTAISGTVDKTVTIANEATASLLCYTPHVGPFSTTGYSGSDNFVYYFKQWFGSTEYNIKGSIGAYYDGNNGVNVMGLPTSNELPIPGGGWYQKFENGYIAGKYNTGYWYVKGSIGGYYINNNGLTILGSPLGSETSVPDGGWYQKFENGYIAGKYNTGYWYVRGSIGGYLRSKAGLDSILGSPLSTETSISTGVWSQKFTNGYIAGSSKSGYWDTTVALYDHWVASGKDKGVLQMPTSAVLGDTNSTYAQYFVGGAIAGSTATGLFTLQGSIGAYYKSHTSLINKLGNPTSYQVSHGNGVWSQKFTNGYIAGSSKSGYWDMPAGVYDTWLSIGLNNSRLGLPVGAAVGVAPTSWLQQFQGGFIAGDDSTDYWIIQGSIGLYYKLNYKSRNIGLPVGNEYPVSDKWRQDFTNGYIQGNGHSGYIYTAA